MSKKNKKIDVQGSEITIISTKEQDYISLTDMVRDIENGLVLIEKWLRNKNTIEFLGIWEEIYNPNFNSPEFEGIKNQAGLNRFALSVKQWVQKTNSIGIIAKAGRYGGTYAHKDIAFEFATWLSPEFKFYVIKEFQRLKKNEADSVFQVQRTISKRNYKIQAQSIKEHLIPKLNPNDNKNWAYASEADLLNLAVWGITAKMWRDKNPDKPSDTNLRDYATVDELIVLSNIEMLNSELIKNEIPKKERFKALQDSVISQFKVFANLKSITFEEIAGVKDRK